MTNLATPYDKWEHYKTSKGLPSGPENAGNGGWKFSMSGDDEEPHIVRRSYVGKIKEAVIVKLCVDTISGNPEFQSAERRGDAAVGVQLQRRGDTWSARGDYAFYRAWSTNRVRLNDVIDKGWQTINCPVGWRDKWIDVWGRPYSDDPSKFRDLLNDLDNVALGFGGSGYSHGVRLTRGKVWIKCKTFKV